MKKLQATGLIKVACSFFDVVKVFLERAFAGFYIINSFSGIESRAQSGFKWSCSF